VIAVATYGPICLLDPIDLRPKSMLELSQTVNNLEISPDGKWLAGSTANYLAIVDLDRLTQVCWTNTGAERLHDIAFSPDSQFVVSPGPGGRVVLWRTADLSLVRYLGKPKGMGNIADLAFSVDGRSVFVSAGHSLERLNAETGSIEAALDLGFGGSTTLAVSPDGSTVAWAALGARLHLCDSVTLELKRYLQGHQAGADTILFSAQGDRLISCARDGIKVWDPAKPGAPRGFQTKEVGPNSAISPNGRFVAWIRPGSDLADLTDIARWQNVARFSLPTNVSIQAVSAAGDWVAASDVVGTVYSIATATSRMVKHLSIRETGPPSLVRFAPSGDNFLTAAPTRDKQILMTLWDAEDPKPVAELPTPMSVVYGLNFSPESHYAVAASYGELLLWDLKKLSHRVLKTVLPGNIYGATFLPPDSSTLVVANMTKGLEFWDFTKDPPVARRIVSRDLWAWDLASSPDGKRLFAPCSGGLSVLSTYSGERLAEFSGLTGPRQPGFAVDPDGNTVVWMTGSQLVTWQAPSFADIDAIEKADSDTLNARKPATRARPVSLNRTP
jgi:WD40 repeat protein